MDDAPVIRLFRCRPLIGTFDATLRESVIPDLRRRKGIVDVFVGRTGLDELGQRLVASVWTSGSAMLESIGDDPEAALRYPEYRPDTVDRSLEILPLDVVARFESEAAPTVMRLAVGTVRASELGAYVTEVRAGAEEDTIRGKGPLALFMAAQPPDAFTTLSIWSEWSAIQAATGADVHRPVATQRAQRLLSFEAVHYEIVGEEIP